MRDSTSTVVGADLPADTFDSQRVECALDAVILLLLRKCASSLRSVAAGSRRPAGARVPNADRFAVLTDGGAAQRRATRDEQIDSPPPVHLGRADFWTDSPGCRWGRRCERHSSLRSSAIPPTPFVAHELIDLLPRAVATTEIEAPTFAKPTAIERSFDSDSVAFKGIERLAAERGSIGTIAVSAGPWRPGAILDGIRRMPLAQAKGYKYHIDRVEIADLRAAKLLRWRLNVTTKAIVPPFLVIAAFLRDDDFRAYFAELARRGRSKMSAGGREKVRSAEPPFNRRLEASQFCGVKPWDFEATRSALRLARRVKKDHPERGPDADRLIRAAEIGTKSAKSLYQDLKNLEKRAVRSSITATIGRRPSIVGTGRNVYFAGDRDQVYQGDAVEVMRSMPDGVVDRVAMSPPYFGVLFTYFEGCPEFKEFTEYCAYMRSVLAECWRVMKIGGMLLVNIADTTEPGDTAAAAGRIRRFHDHRGLVMGQMVSLGCDNAQCKVWYRGRFQGRHSGMGSKSDPSDRSNYEHVLIFRKGKRPNDGAIPIMTDNEWRDWTAGVWEIAPYADRTGAHPCVWPPELARRMALYGAHRDDLLLDPFCGSGVALEEATGNGMSALGIDLNSTSVERAQKAVAAGRDQWAAIKRQSIGGKTYATIGRTKPPAKHLLLEPPGDG